MTLTAQQLNDLVENYCNRVVDEMSAKEMEQMVYEMLLDSFSCSNENDMTELICAIYGEEYYNELVEEVTTEGETN